MNSKFYCIKCGKEGIPVQRQDGKKRQSGHLKKLWCMNCQQLVNHVEICEFSTNYSYEDFLVEREYGNFDEQQNRLMKTGEFKNSLRKKGVRV